MKSIALFLLLSVPFQLMAQTELFNRDVRYTRADTLRGSVTPERAWWDLQHYELSVSVNPETKSIEGKNKVTYKVLSEGNLMQIDLQSPMKLLAARQDGEELGVISDGDAHFVQLLKEQALGQEYVLELSFEGTPRVAQNPPWDGGFTWAQDSNGKPFIANSNQGIGASVWWPNKDHGYDEPDRGVRLHLNVPQGLVAVGNGRLKQVDSLADGTNTFVWEVINPINNYGVNVNVGDYVNFSEVYQGEKGSLDMDYWVLRENEAKAREQFADAARTMEAFEHWFGPYPFYEDSYKLVEVPYLGMEHQSSVTYGNNYQNGYNGRGINGLDWSGTGWGKKFDYIIVHETGHEWFANNITAKDVADLWIHESFTSYSESLFVEYFFGKEAGSAYARGTRRNIQNQKPIIGVYNVHQEGSGDMYFKGNNVLHTLRQIVDDDALWREILRGLNEQFYHQTVTAKQVEGYIAERSGKDLQAFFDQYLRDHRIPTLEYAADGKKINYRWAGVVGGFNMPVDVTIGGKKVRLTPSTDWQEVKGKDLEVDPDFYINIQKVN